MKKLINTVEHIVDEMCHGMALAHPSLTLMAKHRILLKKKLNPNKVTLISGGGSGHEPAHSGFIGDALLDVAICGDIFASPTQVQVYQAIKNSASTKGTLLIIKNYSGDIMNFKNGAVMAGEDGIEVDYVKVDDDIAVQDSLYTVGRRGVAGTIFVHKIAGAAAEMGHSLAEVKAIAQKAINQTKSIGFAYSSCTVPAKGSPTFSLNDNEMEYGVGIHGEPGIKKEVIISATELAHKMVLALSSELALVKDSSIAILINGFGSTPLMELYLFNNAVRYELDQLGIITYRSFVGNYMTSIDMSGASLSFLKLDDELKGLLDVPCRSPSFCIDGPSDPTHYSYHQYLASIAPVISTEALPSSYRVIENNQLNLHNFFFMVDKMAQIIFRNEQAFCQLDAVAGDGDFGMSIAKGFRKLKEQWHLLTVEESIGSFLNSCALIIMEHCGGASGPIWGSAFRGAAKSVGLKGIINLEDFAMMMDSATKAVQQMGERSFGRGAQKGDKTLIDALIPAVEILKEELSKESSIKNALLASASAAVRGAKKTENMVARLGRAGTVGERSLGHPDAGAHALGIIFTEIAEAIQ